MKKYKRYVPYVLVVLATMAVIFGVRAVNNSRLEKLLEVPEMQNGLLSETQRFDGRKWIVPARYVFDVGLTEEQLPALNDPKFVSVGEADSQMSDEVFGLHVQNGDEHRFYTYQVLNWHEVVNDTFGGEAIAVTLSTLSRTGVVYSRQFNGNTLTLGNALKVYNNNSVLKDDATDNLWLQGTGMSISGADMGESLTIVPSETITWGAFRDLYPEGEVLSFETGYAFEYARHPFTSYDNNDLVYFPNVSEVKQLEDKWIVTLVQADEKLAFAHKIEEGFGATNEKIGEQAIVALYDFEFGFVRVFSRVVDGRELTFNYDFDSGRITDEETGTIWNAQGVAVRGDLAGTSLNRIATQQGFWFVISNLFGDMRIARVEVVEDVVAEETEEAETFNIDAEGIQVQTE